MTPNPFARAQFLLSCAQTRQLPEDAVPEVAFAGRSNAGKSSALNALCSQKQLARVSKTPGRTQLINLFEIPGARLVDLPGYGYAAVPQAAKIRWQKVMAHYLEVRRSLSGVVLMVDSRLGLTEAQVQRLRDDYGIYMTADSRINIAGLNAQTVPVLAGAVAAVTE